MNNLKNTTNTLPKTPMKFAYAISKKTPAIALLTMFFVIIAGIAEYSIVYILKLIVDSITEIKDLTIGNFDKLWFLVAIYLGIALAKHLFWRGSGFAGMKWVTKAEALSQKTLFSYLMGHGSYYFSNRFAGNLMSKVSNVSRGLSTLLMDSLWTFLPTILQTIIAVLLIFLENTLLGFALIVWIICFVPINYWLAKKKRPLAYESAKASSSLRGQMVDITSNILAVHHFSERKSEQKHIDTYIEKSREAGVKSWRYSEWMFTFNGLLLLVLYGLMFLGSIYFWTKGQITTGSVVLIISLTTAMHNSLFFIGRNLNKFMEQYGEMEEGLNEIIVNYDIKDISHAKLLKVVEGNINFKDVHFHYKEGTKVFDDLQLKIKVGQKIGLVGESGAGKSTLTSLLLRLYDIQKGQISIDGKDISQVQQESLRNNISFVPQDPLLFHRSIADNICYGKKNATKKEIQSVAKLANAHDFITQLPKQYETMVGERGVKLSGGQKQRIAIARAMLKKAPILLLDEATSALDSESESLVQDALKHLMKGKTVLAIAHRLSTLLAMDRIIVLDKGKIVEDGSHKELLKKKGIYAKLWNHQAGGFIQ